MKGMDVLGVAMREEGNGKQIALLVARGHAGGRAGTLHVEDDAGKFGIIAEAGELRHEGDSRTGGSGHGTVPLPIPHPAQHPTAASSSSA